MIKHSIVLVPFPFDDLSASKVRPALCLTPETSEHKHVIIAFISSRLPDEVLDGDLILQRNSEAWKSTGLTVNSVIRLHKMVTIPKHLIKRKLGTIDSATQKVIAVKIQQLFEKQ